MADNHPLRKQETVALSDLANHALICLPSSNPTQRRINLVFQRSGLTQIHHIETNWSPAIANFVSQTCGLAIVDPFTARYAQASNCVVRPLETTIDFTFGEFAQPFGTESVISTAWKSLFELRFQEMTEWVDSVSSASKSPSGE